MSSDAAQLRHLLGDHWQPIDGWLELISVDLNFLIPTQWPHYGYCQLCQQRMGKPVEGDDPHPHVIAWQGGFYIWDGHTRVARWLRDGLKTGMVRVVSIA